MAAKLILQHDNNVKFGVSCPYLSFIYSLFSKLTLMTRMVSFLMTKWGISYEYLPPPLSTHQL